MRSYNSVLPCSDFLVHSGRVKSIIAVTNKYIPTVVQLLICPSSSSSLHSRQDFLNLKKLKHTQSLQLRLNLD